MNDATLREFCIEIQDPTELFPTLLEVCYGSSFQVCDSFPFFQSILKELWNRELYEQISDTFREDLSIFNVMDRIQFLFSTNESCERRIEFCSSHLGDLDMKSVFSMPFEIVSNIASKKKINSIGR
jgi:hypothetical protein